MIKNANLVALLRAMYESPSYKTKAALACAYSKGLNVPQNWSHAVSLYCECEREWPADFERDAYANFVLGLDALVRNKLVEADRYFRRTPLPRQDNSILIRMWSWCHAQNDIAGASAYLSAFLKRGKGSEDENAVVRNVLVGYCRLDPNREKFINAALGLFCKGIPLSWENAFCLADALFMTSRKWDDNMLHFGGVFFQYAKDERLRDRMVRRLVSEYEGRRDFRAALGWASLGRLKDRVSELEKCLFGGKPLRWYERWWRKLVRLAARWKWKKTI